MKVNILLFVLLLLAGSTSAQVFTSFPDRIYGDTTHAPFYHGVASADPLSDEVLIWTRLTPDSATAPAQTIFWEVADDTTFNNIITSGSDTTNAALDWTLTVNVTGLVADTYYYYRFRNAANNYSRWGRTRTAPVGQTNELRFAVASCSSIFSGYFNGYANIALQENLNAVVHVGDYIYDFVDGDEEIRVPSPYPANPSTKAEWEDRLEYYHLDPDFREAKAMHPFIVMWDNHDSDQTLTNFESKEAFREWVPMRTDTALHVIYRQLSFGNLADLTMIDIMTFRRLDSIAPGETSILSLEQYNWFTSKLSNSTAKWKLVGCSKMVANWSAEGFGFLGIGNGEVFTTSTWDGYQEERRRMLTYIGDNEIDNVMFLTGDMHISLAMDLPIEPKNSTTYDPITGAGSVAVEFMPTSISRGNFDESGVSGAVADVAVSLSQGENPHHVFMEVIQHGYGVLVVRPDSAVAQYWYNPILQQSNQQTLGQEMVVYDGQNHWKREGQQPTDTTGIFDPNPIQPNISDVFPNPDIQGQVSVSINLLQPVQAIVRVIDIQGKVVQDKGVVELQPGMQQLNFNTTAIPNGNYYIYIEMNGYQYVRPWVRVAR